MKVYLCFLRNDARSTNVDTQFLGVSSSESLALNLCATAVIARATMKGMKFWWYNEETKKLHLENNNRLYTEGQGKVIELVEKLFTDNNITNLEELNEHLQVYMRKIGRAERWCEITEIETDEPTFFD